MSNVSGNWDREMKWDKKSGYGIGIQVLSYFLRLCWVNRLHKGLREIQRDCGGFNLTQPPDWSEVCFLASWVKLLRDVGLQLLRLHRML